MNHHAVLEQLSLVHELVDHELEVHEWNEFMNVYRINMPKLL